MKFDDKALFKDCPFRDCWYLPLKEVSFILVALFFFFCCITFDYINDIGRIRCVVNPLVVKCIKADVVRSLSTWIDKVKKQTRATLLR